MPGDIYVVVLGKQIQRKLFFKVYTYKMSEYEKLKMQFDCALISAVDFLPCTP